MYRNALILVNGPPADGDTPVPGSGRGRKWRDETDLPAECAQARQDARFPQADVDQGRSGRDPVAPGEGKAPAVGVSSGGPAAPPRETRLGTVRSRKTFEALRSTPNRGRSGPVSVSFLGKPSCSEVELAFSIPRRVGNAVVRNRLRRRLKAIMGDQVHSLPPGAYVVHAAPGSAQQSFQQLTMATGRAVERATRRPGPAPRPSEGRP